MKKEPPAQSLLARARGSLERLTGRLAPRLQSRLDDRLERLTGTLDEWNRRLAQKALPESRRQRVDALSRQGVRRKLRVVTGVRSTPPK
ncbi:MAG: hypothetical protein R3296_01010 [Oleiphilaceae bacterium]|nr:hypothetical protein [Oleiphilaceae bacterium]